MIRGVPLDDQLRTERLIDWYYEEKQMEVAQTMLLVAASTGIDGISEYINRYINSIFPSDKANEEFLKLNKDILQQEAFKEYKVKRVLMPGEDE